MAKIKNRLLIVLALVMLCAVGIFALSACNGNSDYTVTFMVRENGTTGEWQQYKTVDTNDDGSVTLPAAPEVDGYVFRDWYTDEACSADKVFDETKVTGNITVYALMAEANITLSVTDGSGTASEVAGTLSALSQTTAEYEADALSDNLTFDGWYTDAAFTQKYSSSMDATALYGRYMAAVTIDDGYATVYNALVTPGTAMSEPADEDVLQYYMGEIVYYTLVDSEGNILSKDGNGAAAEFDFSTEIDGNTSMRVMWASPNLEYERNEATGGLIVRGFSENLNNYPVVSIPAYAALDGETTVRLVETIIESEGVNVVCPAATKIIFADGIKMISGFNGAEGMPTAVEEIELPSTLKIIDTAFWNLTALEGVNIPEGVEVILNSFWGTVSNVSGAAEGTYSLNNYSFDIEIPNSVINISRAPSNFIYSSNSNFWYDEDTKATYKKGDGNDYETLISMYDFGTVADVKAGVEYVQVGAFLGMDLDYLYLPSTFQNITYNADADGYPYYIGAVSDRGMDDGAFNLYAVNTMTRYGYAIVDRLDVMERVVFDLPERPNALQDDAIQGKADGNYSSFTALVFDDDDKVVFTGEIASGESVAVRVRAIYEVNGKYETYSVSGIVSDGKLTEQAILDAIGFDSTDSVVVSITQFGDEYFASDSEAESGKTVTCRQYIEVVYSDNPGGAVIELVDGVMTVTGFDGTTALGDSNSGYIVTIPSTYEGVPVTAIANGAFKGEESIVTVSIPSSVTVIGAEAFMDTINLTTVTIAPGGLSVIGRSAFENSGFTSIALPLEKLTDVQPYAFKSEKLQKFLAADGETPLLVGNFVVTEELDTNPMGTFIKGMLGVEQYIDVSTIEIGTFGFIRNGQKDYIGLFKYTGTDIAEKTQGTNSTETVDVTIYDVQLIAVAGGATTSTRLALGHSYRDYYYEMPTYKPFLKEAVVRFEIMEGSVYYLNATSGSNNCFREGIVFGVISKVHKNAFTDMADFLSDATSGVNKIYTNTTDSYDDTWLSSSDFFNTSIFEDGWWEGMDVTSDEYKTFAESVYENDTSARN